MAKKVLIFGLPGSGKTTLASRLSTMLRCVHFNGDEVRSKLYPNLGFSIEERIRNAKVIGDLCDMVLKTQDLVIADFVCPTEETRAAFRPSFTIWMNTITQSRFPDTDRIFERPKSVDVEIRSFDEANDLNSILKKISQGC